MLHSARVTGTAPYVRVYLNLSFRCHDSRREFLARKLDVRRRIRRCTCRKFIFMLALGSSGLSAYLSHLQSGALWEPHTQSYVPGLRSNAPGLTLGLPPLLKALSCDRSAGISNESPSGVVIVCSYVQQGGMYFDHAWLSQRISRGWPWDTQGPQRGYANHERFRVPGMLSPVGELAASGRHEVPDHPTTPSSRTSSAPVVREVTRA